MSHSNITLPGTRESQFKLAAGYYYPVFRRQLMIYLCVSVAISLIVYGLSFANHFRSLAYLLTSALWMLFYFAPFAMSGKDDRMIATMMPVTPLCRWGVLSGYFFVVIPAALLLPQFIMTALSSIITPGHNVVSQIFPTEMYHIRFSPLYQCTGLVPAILAFWGLLYYKENRTMKTIFTMGGALLLFMSSGAFIGMSIGFKLGFEAGVRGDLAQPDVDLIVSEVMQSVVTVYSWIGALSIAFFIFMLFMSYRTIKNFQI